MVRPRTVEAQWMSRAVDLTADMAKAAKMLTVGTVSTETGISASTLHDDLTRDAISNDTARAVLCRPAYRIDRTPLWTPEQLDTAKARLGVSGRSARGGRASDDLPVISYAEADERGLLSVYDIAKLAGPEGVHEQTVRKWSRGERLPRGVAGTPLPGAVAKRRYDREREPHGHTHGPVAVHDGTAIRDWLRRAGLLQAEPV